MTFLAFVKLWGIKCIWQHVDVFAKESRLLASLDGFTNNELNTIVRLTFAMAFLIIDVRYDHVYVKFSIESECMAKRIINTFNSHEVIFKGNNKVKLQILKKNYH